MTGARQGTSVLQGASLRVKVTLAIVALLGVTIGSIVGVRTVMTNTELEAELGHKAELYARMFAQQLEPAVDFDSREAELDLLRSAGVDPDVERAALVTEGGAVVQASPVAPERWADRTLIVRKRRTADGVEVAAPVVSRNGRGATLYLLLGDDRVKEQRHEVLVVTLAVAAGLLLCAVLAAWLLAGLIVARLEKLAAVADGVTRGVLPTEPLAAGAPDELGRLILVFNAMLEHIRTEQERLESLVSSRTAELSASREQFRDIAETTRAIPFELDLEAQRFTYLGPQALVILGYPMAEMQSPGFLARVMGPAGWQKMRAEVAAQLQRNPQYDHELVLTAGDGRQLHLRSSANVAQGVARGLVLDVTERKQLEAELTQAQRLESVGRLAAGVAHEINTPVQYSNDSLVFLRDAWADVMGLLDAYRSRGVLEEREQAADLEFLRENAPRSAERALEGLGRIADIVRSMKAFAQTEQTEMVSCDVREGLESTLTIARNEYKYVAELETALEPVPSVVARPGELNQVWLSLVTNAAQAISDRGERGRITVRSSLERGRVVVSVSDTGCGISDEVAPRIFEQFFTTRSVGKGRGQGLSAARAVVQRHHGDIWFTSKKGEGSTFYVALPVESAESEARFNLTPSRPEPDRTGPQAAAAAPR
ncbi:MAG: PAS domain S-box protein [Archangiaceae bacterium]|nr:PAS domain S-box protein [Archangiaceae bacterium]